jgi:hypothetical protein
MYAAPTGALPSALGLEDLDGDGFTDIATTSAGYGYLYRFAGRGDGTFTPLPVVLCGTDPQSLVSGDLDGDHVADLAVALGGTQAVSILCGQSGGGLALPVEYGCGPRPSGVAAGDMNGDGLLDLLTANQDAASVSILLNRSAITPVLVSDLAADASGGRIVLSWRLVGEGADLPAAVQVQRARAASGPWLDLTPAGLHPGVQMSFEDGTPPADGEIWYRIELRLRSGAAVCSAPIAVRLEASARFRTVLFPPVADPAGTGASIRFSLAQPSSSAQLAIYDVRGGQVWAQRWAAAAGEQTVHWDRRDRNGRVAARGIYVVRLEAGGVVATRKLALIR